MNVRFGCLLVYLGFNDKFNIVLVISWRSVKIFHGITNFSARDRQTDY